MKHIYIAGPWKDRPHVIDQAQKLREAGFTVDCRWLTANDVADDDPNRAQYLKDQAMNDIEDLIKADLLMVINTRQSEGKAVELGMAIAALKRIIIIGDRTNIFNYLNIPRFDWIEEAIAFLLAEEKAAAEKDEEVQRQQRADTIKRFKETGVVFKDSV